MYGTGKIGLWSVIEMGIGIFAGSLPALRPLLSMGFLGSSSHDSDNLYSGGDKSNRNKPRTRNEARGRDIMLDTFHQFADKESDGDSQKYILKETQVTVQANDSAGTPGGWGKAQVLGWKKNQFQG
jgi:hypothetical protein